MPEALALLKKAAEDEDPRVRLHAVRAASFFDGNEVPAALEVAYTILKKDTDYYLDYTLKETLRQLNSLTKETVLPTDPVILSKLLETMSDAELAKAPNVEPVLIARLERKGTAADQRERAIKQLAQLHNVDRVTEIVTALGRLDAKSGPAADEIGKILVAMPAADLSKGRAALVTLGSQSKTGPVRRATWAAIIATDADPAKTWSDAKADADKDAVLQALGMIADPALRAKFQPVLVAALGNAALQGAVLKALPLTGAAHAPANFPLVAAALKDGPNRPAAARALLQLPRESWDKAAAGPLAESIVAWAKAVPTNDRTKQDFVETVQAGSELAALLPPADAARLRKELRGLGVSVFVIKTVREQMRYDTPRLVIEPGKAFEVIFENIDVMPHNIVFVRPGTRQAVAEAVQTQSPDKVDDKGRAYIPRNDARIFAASKMVEVGQKETLKIKAPAEEGEYEYVCTFPGHWMIMWGKMIVTKDVDGYLQAHPQADAATPADPHAHHQHTVQAK